MDIPLNISIDNGFLEIFKDLGKVFRFFYFMDLVVIGGNVEDVDFLGSEVVGY